ncbi:hypothetical protein [Caballeronia sp. ATUFL_M2_KS44]|uniref:hypothetical protein n=1 Tax=Caballeronia sp. ATUFL_M2_KS44 TaxID=2921767 RepID=UPI002028748D|nr:hypothetical protein [Caballeronia sp. ATUFL_M2_KS44]
MVTVHVAPEESTIDVPDGIVVPFADAGFVAALATAAGSVALLLTLDGALSAPPPHAERIKELAKTE